MSMISCISHPAKHLTTKPSLIVHDWQLIACEGDFRKAALLSYFEMKHNAKLDIDVYNKGANDETEQNSESRALNEDTLIRVKLSELREELLGIASEKTLSIALNYLEENLRFITTQDNPDPEKILDRTKYVRFHPEICNAWIRENFAIDGSYIGQPKAENDILRSRFGKTSESIRKNVRVDSVKLQNRGGKTSESENESYPQDGDVSQVVDSFENDILRDRLRKTSESLYINNQSIQLINSINQCACDDFDQSKKPEVTKLENVIDALVAKGLAREKFSYADAKPAIERLIGTGATIETFAAAFDLASSATHGKGFGVNYLAKAVESLMKKNRCAEKSAGSNVRPGKRQEAVKPREYVYNHNLKNAESWAGDLI